MALLEADGLTKRFSGVVAVRDVSFSVEKGEWLGLIGPNGAGKSTLFNMLGGQLIPTEGQLFLADRNITALSAHERFRLGVGRSFQITSLFDRLSITEQMTLAVRRSGRASMWRAALGDRDLRSRVAENLQRWNLSEVDEDTLPSELSYGEQRRLELALSIAADPTLLLLDEPNVGLTPVEQDDLLQRVRAVAEDITVMFVAHDIEMVTSWSDRVLVMHFGELVADEPPAELLKNQFVADVYLGSGVTATAARPTTAPAAAAPSRTGSGDVGRRSGEEGEGAEHAGVE